MNWTTYQYEILLWSRAYCFEFSYISIVTPVFLEGGNTFNIFVSFWFRFITYNKLLLNFENLFGNPLHFDWEDQHIYWHNYFDFTFNIIFELSFPSIFVVFSFPLCVDHNILTFIFYSALEGLLYILILFFKLKLLFD